LCTGEDWNDICSPEDCPIDGIQNVSWEKKGVCKDGVDKADLVEEHLCDPSIPACESFNYSNWSECGQNFRRTRNIISSSPVGCQGGGAVLGEYCLYKYKVFETNNDTDEGDGLSLLDGEGVDESEGFAEVAGSNVESRDTEELEEVLDELNLSREELQILQPKLLVEKRLFVFDVENILDNKILVLGVLIFALVFVVTVIIILMNKNKK